MNRRECLALLGSTAVLSGVRAASAVAPVGAKTLRGAFMILHTPFTETGAVEWDDLTREAVFVDRCGAQGIVWPQGSSGVANLTKDERMRGMEVLADAVRGRNVALVLGVQGKDVAEMLEYARRADALEPDAVIAMPPSTGTSMDDYRAYFRALAGVTRRPVIVQTSGGARDLPPTTDLIVELAKEHPNFGYVKEESDPVLARMRAELAARPSMKGVFGANFGVGWLFEMRLGLDGVITGNAMYADLMATMWNLHVSGRRDELRNAFASFLLMRNLGEQIPGVELYLLKKRGIFKHALARTTPPSAGAPPKLRRVELTQEAIEELEYRLAALRPYLSTTVS